MGEGKNNHQKQNPKLQKKPTLTQNKTKSILKLKNFQNMLPIKSYLREKELEYDLYTTEKLTWNLWLKNGKTMALSVTVRKENNIKSKAGNILSTWM